MSPRLNKKCLHNIPPDVAANTDRVPPVNK